MIFEQLYLKDAKIYQQDSFSSSKKITIQRSTCIVLPLLEDPLEKFQESKTTILKSNL